MSAFHGGQLRTMKAQYTHESGDLRVVRPMIYVRERQTDAFAKDAYLPVINEHCPVCAHMPDRRQHIHDLLAAEEKLNKNLFKNLLATIKPLLNQDYYIRTSDIKKN